MNSSVIDYWIDLIRNIANEMASKVSEDIDFDPEVNRRLKFDRHNDWKRLCSLLDLIGDKELAKNNF